MRLPLPKVSFASTQLTARLPGHDPDQNPDRFFARIVARSGGDSSRKKVARGLCAGIHASQKRYGANRGVRL
jgi:hypothetical protein